MTIPSDRDIQSAKDWSAEWRVMRAVMRRQLREQDQELRRQGATGAVMGRHAEARRYLLSTLDQLVTATDRHAQTLVASAGVELTAAREAVQCNAVRWLL